MKLVSVFDYNDLPDEKMRELVCDEQSNDSFKKVRLDTGSWLYGKPTNIWAEIAQWAIDNGAYVKEDDLYPYVLFSVSW